MKSSTSELEQRWRTLFMAALTGKHDDYLLFLTEASRHLRGSFRKRLAHFPGDIEDLVQDTLLAIHIQRHTYDPKRPLTPWIHAIARYKLVDLLRARSDQILLTDPLDGEIKLTKFDHARLRLIYDTYTRQAYATGLWERVERSKRTHPYVRYITKQDERVRVSHRDWDNLTLPVGDAFWKTHWPPNGWRCRCRVMSMSQRDYDKGYTLDRPGAEYEQDAPTVQKPLKKQAPEVTTREYVNPRTGEVTQIPVGIDPGFAYNPGVARQQALQEVVAGKLRGADPALAEAARRAGLKKD